MVTRAKKSPAQLQREIDAALARPLVQSPYSVHRAVQEKARLEQGAQGTRLSSPSSRHSTKRHHSTKRQHARKLGSIGDVNPIDYGGGYIFSTPESGGPHLEYFEGLDSDERAERLNYDDDAEEKIDKLKVRLYRVNLGKDAKDFLSTYDWADWGDVADSTGQDATAYGPGKLRLARDRARAVEDAAGYHGWANFDSYPLELTVGELKERWGA